MVMADAEQVEGVNLEAATPVARCQSAQGMSDGAATSVLDQVG
jgi:hypothetical protein